MLLLSATFYINFNNVLLDDVVGGKQDYPRRIAKVLTEGFEVTD